MDDIFAPGPQVVALPVAGGGAPISIPVSPAGKQRPHSQPVKRSFRRSLLDLKDPFESAGRQMWNFTFSGSYDLDGQPPEPVAEEIRERLYKQLLDGNLADAQLQVVDFDDASRVEESARRFVVTSTNTRRHTLVTVNTYLRAYGDHLYFSVRSYILPPLSIWKLMMSVSLTYVLLSGASYVASVGWMLGLGFGGSYLFVMLAIIAFVFRKLIRNLLAGDPVLTALRKQFPKRFDWGTFNDDDVTAFLKTNLHLTLRTIASVLDAHGIETGGLRAIVQNLQTVNVNTGGGSIMGAVFGGTRNHAVATGVRA